ncbi:MAG TPA: TetR/AcrR family transcriptional regulator [Mycobacterium sp.]|uniref:TetR/AcrR family transcriptional regulator n=1 Tax=Mycobacterium sp. TaxID=1785 RepID=UPI002C20371A|nr:TetR/AcrR family transcriptional regulator [Mycobacterium sp.]HME75875.1 TetR/AcrR family transcriptional regulator [Mycobacterium sp.]
MSTSAKAGRSPRRGGAPRSLTAEQIVDTALTITRESGIDGLTMSVLAERLSVGVMTLYSYFRGRDELLDAMGQRAALELYETHVDATDAEWQEELRVHYHSVRDSLKRHPTLADLIFFRGEILPADPDSYAPIVAHIRRHVDAMVNGGVPPQVAVRAFFGLSMFTVASALREDDFTRTSTHHREYLDDLVKSVGGGSDVNTSGDARFGSDNEFDIMLDIFIEGIESSAKKRKRQRSAH